MSSCTHPYLSFDVIDSVKFKYRPPKQETISKALRVGEPSRKKAKRARTVSPARSAEASGLPPVSTFPAPVVVPGDGIYDDPDDPLQSVQKWVDGEHRNKVTNRRKTIYVVPPPAFSEDVRCFDDWSVPVLHGKSIETEQAAQTPQTRDVMEYLQAFYHGLPVKLLEKPALACTAWNEGGATKKRRAQPKQDVPQHIGLSTGKEATRIRCRPSGDSVFPAQLNLDDLLDVAIAILPRDAYALLMLVDHDIYENDDDDFCCGRAYGGSRIAIVSTARYRPELDEIQEFDQDLAAKQGSAIAAAVLAANKSEAPRTTEQLSALWLGRVCKTASHELGHCFGIAHCMYYACIMQGTASLAEDARQPPYLCPVDLAKVLRASGASEKGRYRALLKVCGEWKEDRMFSAFGAWIEMRLKQPDAIPS
ncbi:uncharacterized protein LTR77_008148 [Saxophila tyrrhenica]|uniref:Uncharacterized protein n=1 Tax=Saxophila tyrrhenica TaxID=1690608 RepID=A0AAV9P1Y7_9PEZI|nr:hypothetical protein LTR77_008148 [Saxophila tyrrhenica]